MTMIGDTSQFAVEYGLNSDSGGEWLFGRFCYWCGGCRIGEYELGTSLRDVLFLLEQIDRDSGRRDSTRFCTKPAADVFQQLDRALFGGTSTDGDSIAEEEEWARHNIVPAVDVFDSWKAFLVEHGNSARLVYSREPFQDIRQQVLKAGEVDEVLGATRRILAELYNQEKAKSTTGGEQVSDPDT